MTVELKIDCEIPQVPNYLQTPSGSVPIHAVTEAALRLLGAAWTEKLIMRARQMREEKHQVR